MTVYTKDREGENVQRVVLRTQRFFDEPKHQVPGVHFALAAGIIGELAAANQEIIDNDSSAQRPRVRHYLHYTTGYLSLVHGGYLLAIPARISQCGDQCLHGALTI